MRAIWADTQLEGVAHGVGPILEAQNQCEQITKELNLIVSALPVQPQLKSENPFRNKKQNKKFAMQNKKT